MSGIDIKVNAESWIYGGRAHFQSLEGWGWYALPGLENCWIARVNCRGSLF